MDKSYDELVKRLQTGHDSQCAMSYGMHEHCCDCSYTDRAEAANSIDALRHDIARHVQIATEQAQEVERLRQERNAAMAGVNAHYAEIEQLRQDLAAARAERNAAQMDAAKTGEREAVYLSRIQHLMSELEAARVLLREAQTWTNALNETISDELLLRIGAALAGEKK